MIQVNWSRLREVYERLQRDHGIDDDTPVIFHYQPVGHKKKKSTMRFGDFMKFFWTLYENTKIHVPSVVVADAATSRVLYKHKISRTAIEKKPHDNDGNIVASWQHSPKAKRRALLKILDAQIYSHDDESDT